jgi:hypothetical protein
MDEKRQEGKFVREWGCLIFLFRLIYDELCQDNMLISLIMKFIVYHEIYSCNIDKLRNKTYKII